MFAAGLVDLLGNVPAHARQNSDCASGPRTFDLYQSINLGRPLRGKPSKVSEIALSCRSPYFAGMMGS